MNGRPLPLRLEVHGPAAQDGRLPVDDLNLLTGVIQRAVQRIGVMLASAQGERPRRAKPQQVRNACRLSLVAVRAGSTILDFEFTETVEQEELDEIRVEAVERLVFGFDELADGFYLPLGWTPDVLRTLRQLVRVFERDVTELRLLSPGRETRSNVTKELGVKVQLLLERYDALAGRGQSLHEVGTPPPKKRRKKPQLPLFDSGRPELAEEIDGAYGSKSHES